MQKEDIDIPKDILFIKRVYLFFVFLIPIIVIIKSAVSFEVSAILELGLSYFIISSIYYGIVKVKSWCTVLVQVYSAWGAISTLLNLSTGSSDIAELISNLIFGSLITIFYIFSFVVFTKRRTKIFFNETGVTFI